MLFKHLFNFKFRYNVLEDQIEMQVFSNFDVLMSSELNTVRN